MNLRWLRRGNRLEVILISKYDVISILEKLCKSYECFCYTDNKAAKTQEEYDEYDYMMGPIWIEAVSYLRELKEDN